ncbi:TIGR02206 family membrane protein [Jeotgalibacillus proteolyticus]|uniref:TIGR02206 family membrane protein n=1 Tax=Jeotgalibacillus proteolyticus TaxID=2082395 RepID=A0A2S5GFJ5_9BACL|nr:TIGR02206 family membrane protein [Jeotgalibacillus proteolyticus]PPA71817.1 TIGR02206 family membrane protein [Jeotgalibacillus proteolyticus]
MFSPTEFVSFELFSISHIVMIGVFFISFFASILNFRQRLSKRIHKLIIWILASILILSELSYQIWAASVGIWDAKYFIPIQLCSFSTFFGLYLLFKRNKFIFYFFFYVAFFPPVLALMTPDLAYGFPHYFYWKFFLQHIAIPITAVYILYRDKWELKLRSILWAFLILNAFAVPVAIINKKLGSNYFFLSGPPASDTALSFFGEGWVYIIQLEVCALIFFFLTYLIGRGLLKVGNQKISENNVLSG